MPLLLPTMRCALTAPFHPYLIPHLFMESASFYEAYHPKIGAESGGIFSVALSMGLHPPDVIWLFRPMEPGLSSRSIIIERLPNQPHAKDNRYNRNVERICCSVVQTGGLQA